MEDKQNISPTQQENTNISPISIKSQPQISPNVSDISPTPKNKVAKKLILIGLILLIIVSTISGLYIYLQKQRLNPSIRESSQNKQHTLSPTPDSTSDWKTFTNNKYSYSFSFKEIEALEFRSCGSSPSNFSGEERIVFMSIPNSYNVCYPHDGIANIDIWVVEGNKTSDSHIEKDYPKIDYELQIEEISIDNTKAYKIKSHFIGEIDEDDYGFSPPNLTEVRVLNNDYTYHLYLGNEEYEDTYNQILSTFRFIE